MEQESHKFRHEIIKNTIINLLYEIENIYLSKKIYDSSSYGKEYSKSNKELIKSEFLRLIKKDYRQNRQVSFYATTLNISVRYLGRIIKDTSGSTPKELIDELVVSEAKVLLTMRKYNITEVAYALNFSSMADFSRFFKKKTGVSPSHFMKL
ncbi:AraC family transcriptional regulator [Lutibacter sp. B1]|uniref:helix-turn-helix domain-containing protein n=1 Tax=Lutibacter sp. B1 TaxID=2725996 RepID=UPI001456D824|nr:AraC family transcriptional regulator [Lutibacter sp. B1]NLP58344.1 AraC family transcriptional regulator [Lutibacter sp. B1]